MSKIISIVAEMAAPVVKKHGCQLWDVEYVKEAGNWFLRVYIDRAGGVSINDCENISKELDPLLDEKEDLFHDGYTFEVSSAGAERWLRGPEDYKLYIGSLAEVKLYKSHMGQKSFIGIITGASGGGVRLDVAGEQHAFEKQEIAGVRLRVGGI